MVLGCFVEGGAGVWLMCEDNHALSSFCPCVIGSNYENYLRVRDRYVAIVYNESMFGARQYVFTSHVWNVDVL